MEAYERHLSEKFIKRLNALYQDKDSWWHKLADDKDVFVLIRSNRLHAMVHGGLLLKVSMRRDEISCGINKEFLFLRSGKDSYAELDDEKDISIDYVKNRKDFVTHYPRIKRRIEWITGEERKASHRLALRIRNVIDREIGFGDESEGKGVKKVDLAAVSDNGELVFFEVKLFDNKEIRSNNTPAVVNQIRTYEKLIARNGTRILQAYRDQFELIRVLHGRFFEEKRTLPEVKYIHPRVRLIITGFDDVQFKHFLPDIRTKIENCLGWEERTPDLIAIGGDQNITEQHLFKAL